MLEFIFIERSQVAILSVGQYGTLAGRLKAWMNQRSPVSTDSASHAASASGYCATHGGAQCSRGGRMKL